jgi:hypothetical protein
MIDYIDAPNFSREESFKLALGEINKKFKSPTIVEIGTVRQKDDWGLGRTDGGAGNSSELFAWYVQKYGGKFKTCDLSEQNMAVCKSVTESYNTNNNIEWIVSDGIEYVKSLRKRSVHFIYLDALDAHPNDYKLAAELHLELFKASESKLVKNAIISIDDIYDAKTYAGKGYLMIPYALDNGYECLFRGYQFVFKKVS